MSINWRRIDFSLLLAAQFGAAGASRIELISIESSLGARRRTSYSTCPQSLPRWPHPAAAATTRTSAALSPPSDRPLAGLYLAAPAPPTNRKCHRSESLTVRCSLFCLLVPEWRPMGPTGGGGGRADFADAGAMSTVGEGAPSEGEKVANSRPANTAPTLRLTGLRMRLAPAPLETLSPWRPECKSASQTGAASSSRLDWALRTRAMWTATRWPEAACLWPPFGGSIGRRRKWAGARLVSGSRGRHLTSGSCLYVAATHRSSAPASCSPWPAPTIRSTIRRRATTCRL